MNGVADSASKEQSYSPSILNPSAFPSFQPNMFTWLIGSSVCEPHSIHQRSDEYHQSTCLGESSSNSCCGGGQHPSGSTASESLNPTGRSSYQDSTAPCKPTPTATSRISRHGLPSLLLSVSTALLLLLSNFPAVLSQSDSVPKYAVDFTQVSSKTNLSTHAHSTVLSPHMTRVQTAYAVKGMQHLALF